MHILLTGARGRIGSHTLKHLLASRHTVTSIDIHPPNIPLLKGSTYHQLDLTAYQPLEEIFENSQSPIEAVIHLGAIPDPNSLDDRLVHNNNVTSNYNVLKTSLNYGVKRIVQASSVNAAGLTYCLPGHMKFDSLPIDERTPKIPEDGYSISKEINEMQAEACCRRHPGARIASLRFHMARDNYEESWPDCRWSELWCWVSYEASARACLLGITSEGWEGHEVFNIVADEICREGAVDGPDPIGRGVSKPTDPQPSSLALLEKYWPGTKIDPSWWEGRPRRGFWDCRKAERLLGWSHERK